MIPRVVKQSVRSMQEYLERHVLGSLLQEWTWRLRHLYKKGWAEEYLVNTDHPHRDQIIKAVTDISDVRSVLEIGCASGANLVRLREALPSARLLGIDINKKGIEVAKSHFEAAKDGNITLFTGRADDLSAVADGSVDVVMSDAVLMFVAPGNINQVLAEMNRVATRAIILNEYQKGGALEGHFDGGRWVYDHVALLKKQVPDADIRLVKSTFTGGLWDDYGCLIEVRL